MKLCPACKHVVCRCDGFNPVREEKTPDHILRSQTRSKNKITEPQPSGIAAASGTEIETDLTALKVKHKEQFAEKASLPFEPSFRVSIREIPPSHGHAGNRRGRRQGAKSNNALQHSSSDGHTAIIGGYRIG